MPSMVRVGLAGGAAAAAVVAGLVVPWDDLTPEGRDPERPPGGTVVVRDTDNPAPRTREAEQLEEAQRGEREFVRGLKDAARAERTDRIRRRQQRDGG